MNQRGGQRKRSRRRRSHKKKEPEYESVVHVPKTYGVVFFKTLEEAKGELDSLLDRAKEVDQLNIVIRAEANMDDPDLLQYGKVFAGEAWALIHDRRVADGWYDEPR